MLIYKKVFDIITNSWVELPFNTDPKDTEVVEIDMEVWKKNGRVISSKESTKSFSDEDNENSDNEEKEDKE